MANLGKQYSMADLFSAPQTSTMGLTSAGAAVRLLVYGGNVFETKKQSKILANLPLAVENAAVVAMAVGLAMGGGHEAFCSALLALLAADFLVSFAERNSTGESVASALVARLAPTRRAFWVLRDDVWSEQNAAALVLGDVIYIRSGDVVPVDARLLEKRTDSLPKIIMVDQSGLTGDPLLAAKGPGDAVYAGSTFANGKAHAVVLAGGVDTYLAGAVRLADATDDNQQTCGGVLGAARVAWDACIVWACFTVLTDAVAGHLSSYDGDYVVGLLFGALVLAGMGFMLSDYWEESWEDRRRWQRRLDNGGLDPEELMRSLGELREQGKISEETVHRCHELFAVEAVSDELVATLANHFVWTQP